MPRKRRYFAYGSNLDAADWSAWCANAEDRVPPTGPARDTFCRSLPV
jgi:hypothetical protein